VTDPVSAAKAAKAGYWAFKFWRRNEIGKKLNRKLFPKWMARRDAKQSAKRGERPADEAAGEFFNVEDERMNANLLIAFAGSLARHFLPWATALLAGMGVQVSDDASPFVTLALAIGVYVAMQGVSLYRQWQKNKAAAQPAGE
jgi:hypothetical protein